MKKKDETEFFYSPNNIKYKVVNGNTTAYYDKEQWIELNLPEKYNSK